jgi:restriction system protein
MSYYRNYRKPYYYRRRRYGKYSQPFRPVAGIFVLGVAFILLSSIGSDGNLIVTFGKIFIWALILGGIVWLIRKIKNRSKNVVSNNLYIPANATKTDAAEINSEKHGCKCYMDGLTDGEQEVAHVLAEGLSYKDYFIFNNLTIPSDHNGSSQIDHLVISKFGIFVIESKDYKGWIFGSKDQDNWTQSLPGGTNKFQFQNPIRQNWSHIMSLRTLMPFIPESTFQSIVVFTDSCEIKTPAIENVVRIEDLLGCIKKYTENKVPESDLHLALGKLSYVCQTADISPSQHIENLHSHHPEPSLKA